MGLNRRSLFKSLAVAAAAKVFGALPEPNITMAAESDIGELGWGPSLSQPEINALSTSIRPEFDGEDLFWKTDQPVGRMFRITHPATEDTLHLAVTDTSGDIQYISLAGCTGPEVVALPAIDPSQTYDPLTDPYALQRSVSAHRFRLLDVMREQLTAMDPEWAAPRVFNMEDLHRRGVWYDGSAFTQEDQEIGAAASLSAVRERVASGDLIPLESDGPYYTFTL